MRFLKWIICIKIALCMGCAGSSLPPKEEPVKYRNYKTMKVMKNSISITLDVPDGASAWAFYGESPDEMGQMTDTVGSGTDKTIVILGLRPCTLYYVQVVSRGGRSTRAGQVIEVRTPSPCFIH